MQRSTLQTKRIMRAMMIVLLLNAVGTGKGYSYDFSSACSTGQTLYFNITDAINHIVEVTHPGYSYSPWYGFNEPTGSVIIPSSVNHESVMYFVESIGEKAFWNCTGITEVTFHNSLQSIGELSFYNCNGLTNITIPASITSIHERAFQSCSQISTLNFNAINCSYDYTPTGQYYGASYYYSPFYECYSLTSLIIGEGVQVIPSFMFYDCNLTGNLTLPSSLITIGDYAFSKCDYLTGNLFIPNGVTNIGYLAFELCRGFTSIGFYATNCQCSYYPFGVLPTSNSITSINIGTNVQSIPDYFFAYLSGVTSLSIPNSVTSIGHHAFYSCSGITSLIVPDNVITIDSQAFAECTGLTTVSLGTNLSTLNSGGGFNNLNNLQSFIFNSTCCYNNSSTPAFLSFSNVSNIQIGSNVQRIPEGFLYGSTVNTPIVLPDPLTTIGGWAFRECHLVDTLTIPQLVTNIGEWAFALTSGWSKVKSMASTPPSCGSWAFHHNYGSPNPPLEVPCGCVSVYSNASGWNQFQNISELDGCTYQITLTSNPSNGGTVSGSGTYSFGSNCTIAANANSNFCFINWTENGVQVSSNPNYSFTVTTDRSLVANFQYEPTVYNINASANPSNGGTITGTGNYNQGQTCTLTAIPNTGFSFLKWTENGSQVSTNPTYSFIVNGNRTLVAHFQNIPNQYTITLSANPSNGGTVSGGGNYTEGQMCTAVANANPNYSFVNWTENGVQVSSNSTYSFTVTGNRSLVANFQSQPNQYIISLTANPTSGGTISGGGTYSQGQTCTVTADANSNYSFVNWTENGTQVSTNSTYSFTVTGNRTLVANFSYAPAGYMINATAEPSYGGMVSGAGSYNQGQTCTLVATPNPNYDFVNWTEGGNVVSTNATYSFIVNGNRTLVAHFESQVFTITAYSEPSEGGTVYGDGSYSGGITCHLIAVPNNDYSFMNWTENGVIVSSDSDYSFVVTGNRTLIANFYHYDAIEEFANSITINPNPTKGFIRIEAENLKHITISDMLGLIVYDVKASGNEFSYDFSRYETGVYLIRIETEKGMVMKRVVVAQ